MTPPHADRYASSYVLWSELACHDALGTPYPLDVRASVLPKLLTAFEAARAIWGLRIDITSAYRTPAHNKAIGGAVNSQHCKGTAVDFEPPAGVTPIECYRRIVALATSRPDLRIGYVCGYAVSPSKPKGQIHLDVRQAFAGYEWKEA